MSSPIVPPPVQRKPTASEKADTALALIEDLDRKIESAFGTHPDLASNVHAAPALTDEQAAALAKVPALDQDIDALGKALNEVAETVAKVGDWAGKDVAAYEKLREDIRTTLAEVRQAAPSAGGTDEGARAAVTKLREDFAQLSAHVDKPVDSDTDAPSRQDLFDSILALAGRISEVEKRPASGAVVHPGARVAIVPGVLAKVLKLQNSVASLGKDKTADPKMGGYKFRSIDSAMDEVGRAMREVGLILRTEIISSEDKQFTANGKLWTTVTVKARYVFVDPEDASEHALEMVGEGRDLGDKSTSKAASMAFKYALLQGLCIPFGAPESDGETTPPIDLDEDRRYQDEQAAQRDRARVQHERREAQQGAARNPITPPGGHTPDADAPPPEEPIDDRTPGEKAVAVVTALNKLNSVPLAEARARLDRITTAVQGQGLGGLIVDGSNLALHLKLHDNLISTAERQGNPRG